jgi:hypothetical protein
MNSAVRVFIGLVVIAVVGTYRANQAQKKPSAEKARINSSSIPITAAVEKGAKWLASVQGADGGWGQDGGGESTGRADERMESNGNDVANTAVAALALLRAGKQYQPQVDRALAFILRKVEESPDKGLAITDRSGTQIQRKLGPYIDTFLTSMLLAQVDGTLGSAAQNSRVRAALQKCVAKIEQNQQGDGSWNIAGGWAPVLGTSMASRSLYEAKQKGVTVQENVLVRADDYTIKAVDTSGTSVDGLRTADATLSTTARRIEGIPVGGRTTSAEMSASAGVELYQNAQALEQLSRTAKDRKKNAAQISALNGRLSDTKFVEGFGSIGGEEFFSYLNISDSLKRSGGEAWTKWHSQITQKILKLQNNDGTWAGHHCITGRVAVTAAAILNLTVDYAY